MAEAAQRALVRTEVHNRIIAYRDDLANILKDHPSANEVAIRTILAALVLAVATMSASAQTFSPDDHARKAIERRAVEAVIWGMPGSRHRPDASRDVTKTRGKVNEVIYWVARWTGATSYTHS